MSLSTWIHSFDSYNIQESANVISHTHFIVYMYFFVDGEISVNGSWSTTLRYHYRCFLPHDAMLVQYMLLSCVRLSVCPSITSQHCTKTAKRRIMQTMPYDRTGTLILWCERPWRNSNAVKPNGGAKQRCGKFKLAIFDQYLPIFQKRCKVVNRNSYTIYWMVLFPVPCFCCLLVLLQLLQLL